ncbi:variable surface protein [Plasmodium gonderi]|uniref:Variable surface protein n=1 Tax=Plasmodium gonderi TaxID=77519 RepID=A0A1Y1JTH1_PLAGO|nr:variable surface protein [Plasmodium gonderi]GAW84427.1 variable surface protein [Plasmodium gonderi]
MTHISSVKKDFDFTGIFPKCRTEYIAATVVDNNAFYSECSNISREEGIKDYYYINFCSKLSNYLNHIKNKSDETDIKRSCKYLNYKIKDELKKLKPYCNSEKECYKKIVNSFKVRKNLEFDKCEEYIENLDEGTFYVLVYLNDLYGELENFEQNKDMSLFGSIILSTYSRLSRICEQSDNESFRVLLEDFKLNNNVIEKDITVCPKFNTFLHNSSRKRPRIVVLASFITTFTILIIAFILHKYTPFFIYLQVCIRKLRSVWSKKNNESTNIINIHQGEYKIFSEEVHRITYGSLF